MTMRITKHQKIGGVSALDARKVLRKYHERFREDWLEEALSELPFRRKFGHGNVYFYPEEDRALRRKAAPLIIGLLEEGFIEPDEEETQKEKNTGHDLTGREWYSSPSAVTSFAMRPLPGRFTARTPTKLFRDSWSESALSTTMTAFCTGSRLSFSRQLRAGSGTPRRCRSRYRSGTQNRRF
jgi:hypothetical protein